MADSDPDNKVFFTRRRLVKGIGTSGAVGAVGAAGLLYASQPALASHGEFTADALNIEANDESVTEVEISPSLTLDWSNFSSGVSGFDITVKAAATGGSLAEAKASTGISDGTSEDVAAFSVEDLTAESGNAEVDLEAIPLVDGGNGPIAESDLPSNVADGEEVTESVDIEITVIANSASGGESAEDATPVATLDVTLSNTAGETTTSGTVSAEGTTE